MTTTDVLTNPLLNLRQFGQSVWLDYIRRSLITSGELRRLIEDEGLRGVTSNPSIFEKAIAGSTDYTDLLDRSRAGSEDPKTCLLYTSPSPRDRQKSRMPSSA